MNKALLAFANALENRAMLIAASSDDEGFDDETELAVHRVATAAAGATALLFARALRDITE